MGQGCVIGLAQMSDHLTSWEWLIPLYKIFLYHDNNASIMIIMIHIIFIFTLFMHICQNNIFAHNWYLVVPMNNNLTDISVFIACKAIVHHGITVIPTKLGTPYIVHQYMKFQDNWIMHLRFMVTVTPWQNKKKKNTHSVEFN